MTATDIDRTELDAELAARLERLAARSSRPRSPATRTRGGPNDGRSPVPAASDRPRRRHPARRSRIASLALSLATTLGLAIGFAATDDPTSSVVTAQGGVIAATSPNAAPNAQAVVNGDVFTNRWGPVQVQATFAADGSLTSVDAVQVPSADGKSVRINDRAVPTLNSAALTAQSAHVDTVSGATYTSAGYEQSLQSAIDNARAAGLTQLA